MWDRELKRSRVLLAALLLLAVLATAGCSSQESDQQLDQAWDFETLDPSDGNPAPLVDPQIVDTERVTVPDPAAVLELASSEEVSIAVDEEVTESEEVEPPAEEVVRLVSFQEAESTFHDKQFEESMELFHLYVQQHPDNPWGHYMVGLSAWKAGQLTEAESSLERDLALEPTDVKSLRNLGRVFLEMDRPEDALDRFEQALALEPESSENYRLLGRGRSELGEIEAAIAAYRQALVFDKDDAWSLNNLGLILIQQGRFEEALSPLTRAVELRDDIAVFQNNLGIALERTDQLGAAVRAYREAFDLDNAYLNAGINLTRVEGLRDLSETEAPAGQ